MKNQMKQLFRLALIGAMLITSCKKEDLKDQNQNLINRMKSVTDSIVLNVKVPGIVALVVDHRKGIDWIYAAGLSDVSENKPMDADYTFRIASNTKTMTGTVLLQLVDEGRISLEDKLAGYFPEFPRADEVTIGMLCNMTSGFFNYTDDERWGEELDPAKVWTPRELVEIGFENPFYFDPGTDWHYSNTNTILLGMIIEKITGNSLQHEVENRIVKPLKLNKTALQTNGNDFSGPHGRGYMWNEEMTNCFDVTNEYDASWTWAAGSAVSSPRELQKYVQTLVEGGLLSENLQHKRLSELHSLAPGTAYGYNILKRGTFFGHNGGIPGFTSSMYHSKDKNCTIIIYFNFMGELHPDFLFYRFVNILYGTDD